MSDRRRTSYQRAVAGFDEAHERELLEAITAAVIETSKIADANVIAIRTGELSSALLTMLAGTLAMSPSATRSPTAIRRTVDQLSKRLHRRLAAAERDPAFRDFLHRCFHGTDVGGRA